MALMVGLGLLAGSAGGSPSSSALTESACHLLTGAGPSVGAGGHEVQQMRAPNTCRDLSCWQEVTDNGQTECGYGRGAGLTLGVEDSAKQAQAFVRRHGKGFTPVQVGADKAAIAARPGGVVIVMAVGSSIAVVTFGAFSDTDASPAWPGVRAAAIAQSKKIALRLHRAGCPAHFRRC